MSLVIHQAEAACTATCDSEARTSLANLAQTAASEVACVQGECVVSACERGFELVDGACVKKGNKEGLTAQQLLLAAGGFA
jgi:hypothetical protein